MYVYFNNAADIATTCSYACSCFKASIIVARNGALPELLGESLQRIRYRLDWLRELDQAYTDAVKIAESNATIKAQVASSFLSTAIPRQVMRECRALNFEAFPRVLEPPLKNFFSAAATVPCELANRSGRKLQTRAQDHCRLSAERVWMAPYKDIASVFASFVSLPLSMV